jgi:hypothetical protein
MSARLVSPAFVSRRVCSCRRCGGVSKRPRQRDLRAWGVRARHATGAHQDLRAAVERQVRAPPRRVVVRSRCRVAAVRAALREALRAACGWPPSTRGPRHGRWCDRAQRASTRCARRARGLCSTHRGATMRYLRSDRSGPSTALRLLLTPHGDHARGGCILAVGPVIDDDQLSLANKPIARTGVPLPALMVVEDGVADVLVGDSIADARSAAWSVNKTRIGARTQRSVGAVAAGTVSSIGRDGRDIVCTSRWCPRRRSEHWRSRCPKRPSRTITADRRSVSPVGSSRLCGTSVT